jgi:signal transduction histidine kinase
VSDPDAPAGAAPTAIPARAQSLAGQVRGAPGGARLELELPSVPSGEALAELARVSVGEGSPLEELREQNEALVAALEERRRIEARLALANETANLGVLFLDLETGRLEANARARVLHGAGEALPDPQALLDGIREGAEQVRDGLTALVEGRIGLFETTYLTRSGRWVSMRARLEPGAPRVNATLLDVSQQKQQEEEQRRRAELREMMMGVASHDLRSPLQTIQTGLALLRDLVEDREDARRIVRRVEDASAQAGRLVTDFFDYTQAHLGGGLPLEPELCDLLEIAEGVASSAGLERRGVDIRVRGSSARVRGDPARLTQALTNLVDNAVGHREEGTPIWIDVEPDGDEARLRVANHGDPIPPEARETIFEPFARGREPRRKGLGLGLHIVKLVAEAHGGWVRLRSSPGEAETAFELVLPRAASEAAPARGEEVAR